MSAASFAQPEDVLPPVLPSAPGNMPSCVSSKRLSPNFPAIYLASFFFFAFYQLSFRFCLLEDCASWLHLSAVNHRGDSYVGCQSQAAALLQAGSHIVNDSTVAAEVDTLKGIVRQIQQIPRFKRCQSF